MSHLSDIANIIIGLVREADEHYDTFGSRSKYDTLMDEVKVELASLIQDSIHDKSISDEAEQIMAIEIAKDH